MHVSISSDDVFAEYTRSQILQHMESNAFVLPSTEDRSLVQKAFLALSTTFFGMEHKEKQLITRGFRHYGVALKHIRQALDDPCRVTSFDLIESILTMSLFEVRYCTYMHHIRERV